MLLAYLLLSYIGMVAIILTYIIVGTLTGEIHEDNHTEIMGSALVMVAIAPISFPACVGFIMADNLKYL